MGRVPESSSSLSLSPSRFWLLPTPLGADWRRRRRGNSLSPGYEPPEIRRRRQQQQQGEKTIRSWARGQRLRDPLAQTCRESAPSAPLSSAPVGRRRPPPSRLGLPCRGWRPLPPAPRTARDWESVKVDPKLLGDWLVSASPLFLLPPTHPPTPQPASAWLTGSGRGGLPPTSLLPWRGSFRRCWAALPGRQMEGCSGAGFPGSWCQLRERAGAGGGEEAAAVAGGQAAGCLRSKAATK